MNPPQRMNEREIQEFGMRFYQHNQDLLDKLEDFSMHKIFRYIDRDENRRPIMDEHGNWQHKEITERAKAFEDWKDFIDKKRKKVKDLEKNSVATDSFLNRMVNERSHDMPEIGAISKEINKNKINKHLVERNLGNKIKGKEWDTLPQQNRKDRINELEILDNPVSKYQKNINDLIRSYEAAHHKQTNFNTEIQKRASQPGFEFLKFK